MHFSKPGHQNTDDEENRVLMRAWLINQLNCNYIPGLEWHDKQRTSFRVPWVHGSRRCWTMTDGEVFMKWAMHTGKFVDGRDPPDHKKWKANFRCAINSLPDVVEMKNMSHKKGATAYRVYQLQQEKARRSKCRRFTGLHVGKGSRPKTAMRRRRPISPKNYIKHELLDLSMDSDSRVPSTASPASPSYSEGIYSPAPSFSPSASPSSSSDCSASRLQSHMEIPYNNPHSPNSVDEGYSTSMGEDSPAPHQYLDIHHCDIGSECIVETDIETDAEIIEAVAHLQNDMHLPDIKTLLESLDASEDPRQVSAESFEYTELAPVRHLTKSKVQEQHNQVVFC